jgi:hypothetical protein
VAERILTIVALTIGSAIIAYAVIGRLLHFHRPLKWEGGGHLTFTAELCIGTFVLSMGLAILHSPAWIIPALAAWIGGFVSQRRANRRHTAAEEQLRATNSIRYPGVFDVPPLTDIDAVHDGECDVYDAGACTYLGRAAKSDVKALINRLGDLPEQGPNDLFLIEEDIGMFSEGEFTDEFVAHLNREFEKRDYLVLRWMPISHTLPHPASLR